MTNDEGTRLSVLEVRMSRVEKEQVDIHKELIDHRNDNKIAHEQLWSMLNEIRLNQKGQSSFILGLKTGVASLWAFIGAGVAAIVAWLKNGPPGS